MNQKICSNCSKEVKELHQRDPALCHTCWNKQNRSKNIKPCIVCSRVKSCTSKNMCGACYKKLRQAQGYVRPPNIGECLNCHNMIDIVARGMCEACFRTEYHKEWYEKNRESKLKQIKEYRETNIGTCVQCNLTKGLIGKYLCESCYQKQYRLVNYEKIIDKSYKWYHNNGGREQKIFVNYDLSKEEYNRLQESQNGLCAICNKPEVEGFVLSVDHNHETGVVRGLLCRSCNSGIGMMKDDPTLLDKAKDYLYKHNAEVWIIC